MPLTQLIRCLFLFLLLLRQEWGVLCDFHSLSYDFTVMTSTNGTQPWCQVQGSIDGKPFLHYDSNSDKAKPLGLLGEKVNTSKSWEEQTKVLKQVGQELRMLLADTELNTDTPTFQVKLMCQQEADKCTGAFWKFNVQGQMFLFIDTMNNNWTVGYPGAASIKEKWQKDREVAGDFQKISHGDCNDWLRKFLVHLRNMLQPTEPPSVPPATVQLSNISIIIIVITVILILILIAVIVCYTWRNTSGREFYQEVPRSTSQHGCIPEVLTALTCTHVSSLNVQHPSNDNSSPDAKSAKLWSTKRPVLVLSKKLIGMDSC